MKNRELSLGNIVPVALALALVVGCGGSGSPIAPDQQEEAHTPLSYAQIAGNWRGTGEDAVISGRSSLTTRSTGSMRRSASEAVPTASST